MADHLDVPLEDAVLLEEVELISTLMIAASEHRRAARPEPDRPAPGASAGATVPEQQSGRSA